MTPVDDNEEFRQNITDLMGLEMPKIDGPVGQMAKEIRVLIVEDSEDDVLATVRILKRGGFSVAWERVETAQQMESALKNGCWDLIVCDYVLPCFSGLAALEMFRNSGLDMPFIVVSGKIGEDKAIEAMKAGANDYVMKDRLSRLVPAVERELIEAKHRAERWQAQQALALSEQRYRLLAENVSDVIWVADMRMRPKYISPSITALLGCSVSEAMSGNLQQRLPAATISILAGIIAGAQAKKGERNTATRVAPLEIELKHRNGNRVWAETTATILRGPDEQPAEIMGVLRDITERKRAETDRMIKEKAIGSSTNAISIADSDGKITYVNPAFLGMWGYKSSAEVLGKPVTEYWPNKEPDQYILESLHEKGSWEGELVKKGRDGLESYSQLSITSVVDSDNRPIAIMSSFIDLTERRRVEEATRRAAQEWRTTFDSINDFVSIHDRDYKIVRVNRSLAKLFKMEPKEVLGRHCHELFHGSNGPCPDCPYTRTIVTKMPAAREMFHAGLGMFIEVTTSPILDGNGEVTGCVHLVRDISERKRAQQAQEELTQQLQAHVCELEAFSYGIAHDLRSPLVSVEGFCRLLRQDLESQEASNVAEDIRLLESGVRKMRYFLNSTLEYSRAGHLVERTNDVSFGEIVKRVMPVFDEQLRSIGATVSIADDFPRVYADSTRVAQLLTNLIQNSIKYRSKTVPLKIEIGCRRSRDEDVFFVCDNGIGIEASDVAKVFDLFYRGTAEGEGSGIGLAIVKKIVEAHRGRIWVERGQSGKGTIMCFTLSRQGGMDKGDDNGKDQNTSS